MRVPLLAQELKRIREPLGNVVAQVPNVRIGVASLSALAEFPDVISVALLGDCAIASGLIEASWKDEHDNLQRSTFRFLAVLQKQQGSWKLVATQSTKLTRPAEARKK